MKRPGLWMWLRYSVGAGLPAEYNAWVLHDATTPTWLLRHFGRVLTVIAGPLVLLGLFIPAGPQIQVLTPLTVGLCQVLLFGIIGSDMTERRLVRAGYSWGTGEQTRATRAVEAQRTANRERRERIAARRAWAGTIRPRRSPPRPPTSCGGGPSAQTGGRRRPSRGTSSPRPSSTH